jgi:hypothetical protein
MSLLSIIKGPKYTTSSIRTSHGQDHLGIRSVGISMADQLQAGITSITPRARYWSFFAWVLHDFIQNTSGQKTNKNFKQYLKKQEWFFILANVADAEDRNTYTYDVIGITKGTEEWRKTKDLFEFVSNYVQDSFGGYGTYRNVMKILGITKIGDENRGIHIDRLKPVGKLLAEAFEQSIQHTEYYQTYRLQDLPVPRDVILEYGKSAALDRLKESTAKDHSLLAELFLPEEPKTPIQIHRKHSMYFYMTIIQQSNGSKLTPSYLQDIMYDGLFEKKLYVPDKIQTVAKGWEIYQARQLFTYSLDTMWSYLLFKMSKRVYTMAELIHTVLIELENSGFNLSQDVKSLKENVSLNQDIRKTTFDNMKNKEMNAGDHVWKPLFISLLMYVRLRNRNDFESFHENLLKLGGKDSISFTTWMQIVESYQDKTVKEFLSYILRYYVLEQHQKVALNKMITTRNETYRFVENDGRLYFMHEDRPSFNVFRVNQGLTILVDLGFIEEIKDVYQVTPSGKVKLSESN